MLYQAGQATQEMFDTIPETGDDFATAMEKVDNYFTPKKNVTYEIFQFRKAVQQSREMADQFATRLRKLASTCEFTDLTKELKSTIIQNWQSKRLRRVALREDLSLDALLDKVRSQEASEEQEIGIEQMQWTSEAVNVLQYKKPPPRDWQSPRKQQQKVRIHVVIVDFCGPIRMACDQQKVKHARSVGNEPFCKGFFINAEQITG